MHIHIERLSAALFGAIILILGIWAAQNLYWPGNGSAADVIRGKSSHLIEQRYEEHFPLRDWITGAWAAFNYRFFKDGHDGVLVGEQEWLFTTEEYRWGKDALTNVSLAADYIASVDAHLAARDIELVVVLIPGKVQVYQEFSKTLSPQVKSALYQVALDKIGQSGLAVYPALKPLVAAKADAQTFMRTDTHWSPHGAQQVAKGLAEDFAILAGDQNFVSSEMEVVPFSGDLMEFIPVTPYFAGSGPERETLKKFLTEQGDDGAGLGLFADEPKLDLALVGTSYSANDDWHFTGFLKSALGRDLLDYSVEGQGPFNPMQALLNKKTFQQEGIRQVVWEIPVRYLVQPIPSSVSKPSGQGV